MAMIVENEKVFEYFTALPAEVRMMMVDEMKADDRCRFTRCSKLSQKEAKSSKNYIHALLIDAQRNSTHVYVKFEDSETNNQKKKGYVMCYEYKRGAKYIKYLTMNFEELWREELDISTDIDFLAAGYFKNLLKLYQNNIKRVNISGFLFSNRLKTYDFEIERFRNLERLEIEGVLDVPQYLSKTQRPLKTLLVARGCNALVTCEQIYQVRTFLSIPGVNITNEQFLRLRAEDLFLSIGSLTERNIIDFIRSWQNGTIEKVVNHFLLRIDRDSSFDVNLVFRRLTAGFDEIEGSKEIVIKQNMENGKSAKLIYKETYQHLTFDVQPTSSN